MNPLPRIPQVGVIAVVPDRWGPLWQVRHHVLTRLARYFHVAWIEPSVPWRLAVSPPYRATSPRDHLPVVPDNFLACIPERWLPGIGRPAWLGRFVYGERLRRARRLLAQRGCSRFVLYLWRPEFDIALATMRFDFTCYHIDDEYTFSTSDVPISEREETLIRSVDHVFVHSPALLEKKGSINPNTTVCPNGVDFDGYSTYAPQPSDLAELRRPVIGYAGSLKDQLDWGLVERLAVSRPDWQFVFVGPVAPHVKTREAVERLSGLVNVSFLGPKPVWELAAYPQHFDVCIMPYRLNAYTRYIYPLKLHEYLASGTPVVASRIRSLEDFAAVIDLADSDEDWQGAILSALKQPADALRLRLQRQAVARNHDWNVLVRQIAGTIATRLRIADAEVGAR